MSEIPALYSQRPIAVDSTATTKETAPPVTIGAAHSTATTKETAPSQVAVGTVDSTATTKETAPPVAAGDAHSTTTGDGLGAAAGENSADETRANTGNIPVLAGVPALPAHNNEATKKRPAAGDIFRFQPNNCVEWNLFGEEYSKSNPRPTKQDVHAAYDALSADEKQIWSQRRSDKLANRKASGKKRE